MSYIEIILHDDPCGPEETFDYNRNDHERELPDCTDEYALNDLYVDQYIQEEPVSNPLADRNNSEVRSHRVGWSGCKQELLAYNEYLFHQRLR